jgi:hypothetical protein
LATGFRAGFALFADFLATFAFGFDTTLRFAGFADIFADFFVFAADFEDFFAADLVFFFFAGFAISKFSLVRVLSRAVLSYIPIRFSTTIIAVRRKTALLAILLTTACSRLSTLTPESLATAESKWNASRPALYRLVTEMKGDRVEKQQFQVIVRDGKVESISRNGQPVSGSSGEDYSMDGLFHILHQEMGLAQKPALLGAPEGYSAYLMADFDEKTGRLVAYRRTVGGTSNTIDIKVLEFDAGAAPGKP